MAESFRRSLRAPLEAESRVTPKYSDARALSANSARGYGLNSEPALGRGKAKGAGRVDYSAACGVPRPPASIATATDCTIAAKRTAV